MTKRDYMLILRAIENCEDREKQFCDDCIKYNPEDQKRIEANRDMFLYATMMVRFEIERMIKEDEKRLRA